MSKLGKIIRKSSLMDIRIKHEGELVKFNLADELVINEAKINSEIKEQPSYYGYLCILMNRLERIRNDKKAELSKTKAKLFIKYKSETDSTTGRALNNDLAESKVEVNVSYRKALKKYNRAEENYATIKSCVDAFNQRSHLIQSLSANVRKERDI